MASKPRWAVSDAAALAHRRYGLEGELAELPSERDQNFRIERADGARFVLKISNPAEDRSILELQDAALKHLRSDGVDRGTPEPIPADGETILSASGPDGTDHHVRLLGWLPGRPLAKTAPQADLFEPLGRFLARLDERLAEFDHPAADRDFYWDLRRGLEVAGGYAGNIADSGRRARVERMLDTIAARKSLLDGLPQQVIHGDANDYNLVVDRHPARPRIGLIDFGDMGRGWRVADLAILLAYAMLDRRDPLSVAARIASAYHRTMPLDGDEIVSLFPLACLRICTSLSIAAHQRKQAPDNDYLGVTEKPAWRLLESLEELEPALAERVLREACDPESIALPVPADLRERRARLLGPSLGLSYDRPLTIVRGSGAYLYDSAGHAYLDCVNNVCHVGHSNAEVAAAAARQMRTLNTNTRYLHPTIVEYAERLSAWLPEPLEVCFFVNSGSEANELALRIARVTTGRQGIVAVEAGYHGNTGGLIDVGSYKCESAAGQGPPDHVRFVPLPDSYRGRYRGAERETAERYAAHVTEAAAELAAAGHPPAAFLAEAWSGCGGQIVPPERWLDAAFREARAAGALCIADEVQTGFGRLGLHRWAFEQQSASPDIVTLGKPIGNGHPLGAVVTRREIAAAFDNGMEYFNTFGGNPVSCATGLAVLRILERDDLQAHARRVGETLLEGLRALSRRHPSIGDVRGSGLFLGVELVQVDDPPRPDAAEAKRIVERMREKRILLSADGPQRNVIKIKPPLVFSRDDAVRLLDALSGVLDERLQPR
ncbi:MAG: aminotransferase class III-fold pyridoxal phosphate-dependent enzyme [Acidobacteria bacterium]|nr:aminotransferase class III-fold pyridoxal phosphate-dependent enzyme [Acidobacteriota bacterium]NIM60684.1 aminotransferase class III-fold pyridoxal phosphate-dependent enzyme [Acidobacteriota bacterium]NIO58644.1 aminotransferase class III-fold pyridoxal phosphate-dependent enzyme [Acidobacteriota bacterium]NIQ29700.1 aminotransferase class III-fold pyridoxal phosphate-dependent enzyme [Acidobacteriota bacterium]NIQ84417.1 aminotransferase class III-fold pyridoxal phosphate-dependent enzyme